jgi:hypothetical protein
MRELEVDMNRYYEYRRGRSAPKHGPFWPVPRRQRFDWSKYETAASPRGSWVVKWPRAERLLDEAAN